MSFSLMKTPICIAAKLESKEKHQQRGSTQNIFLLYFQYILGDFFLTIELHFMETENWHVLSTIEHQCRHKKFPVPYLTWKTGTLARKQCLSNRKEKNLYYYYVGLNVEDLNFNKIPMYFICSSLEPALFIPQHNEVEVKVHRLGVRKPVFYPRYAFS